MCSHFFLDSSGECMAVRTCSISVGNEFFRNKRELNELSPSASNDGRHGKILKSFTNFRKNWLHICNRKTCLVVPQSRQDWILGKLIQILGVRNSWKMSLRSKIVCTHILAQSSTLLLNSCQWRNLKDIWISFQHFKRDIPLLNYRKKIWWGVSTTQLID